MVYLCLNIGLLIKYVLVILELGCMLEDEICKIIEICCLLFIVKDVYFVKFVMVIIIVIEGYGKSEKSFKFVEFVECSLLSILELS